MLRRLVDGTEAPIEATLTVAERDPVDPLPRHVRAVVGRHLLEAVGFTVTTAVGELTRIDPAALVARRG